MDIHPTSLYKRYLNGQIVQVWQELTQLNQMQEVIDDAVQDDIVKIYKEIMKRTRHNIETIIANLLSLNYQFMELGLNGWEKKNNASQFPVYAPPTQSLESNAILQLEALIQPYGNLPLSFTMFLQEVGSVNLVGFFPNQEAGKELPLLDPLMVFPTEQLVSYHRFVIDSTGSLPRNNDQYYLQFSHNEEVKEGISGSGLGYGIKLYPQVRLEGTLVNYGIDLDFINYLRLCFKWGGFPNLEWFQQDIDPSFLATILDLSKKLEAI